MSKVFISHSSKDKDIVCLFKDIVLKSGLGLSDADIFFTSSPETGVPIGGNIPQYIQENMIDCEFVFLMLSENYKKSEVCQNEMGAAMVSGKRLFPVLLYDYAFDKVGWLINRNLCIRINEEERLDEIRDIFNDNGFPSKTNVWNRWRDNFLYTLSCMSKSNKESVVKGLLDCQLEITENQDIYKKNVNYINEVIPDFVEETRNLIEEHNASPDCKERKVILENLATVLNHWADEIERAIPLISDSLTNSVRAVEDILKIKSLSNEDKYFWVDDLSSFLPSCKENYEALKSHRQKIESQADMLESQILAKLRLLSVYDALLVVYDVSINKIREILLLGKTNL